MFDLTSSKLLILGVVALIVVGPKELPFLLRTIGKYVGMIRRQANEFRAQFDEAMRDAELESIKKEVESVARDAENTLRDAQTTVERDIHAAEQDFDKSLKSAETAEPAHTYDALNGLDTGSHAAAETGTAPKPSAHDTPSSSSSSGGMHSAHVEPLQDHAVPHADPVKLTAAEAPALAKTGT